MLGSKFRCCPMILRTQFGRQNAAFIRSQQTLGAEIVAPVPGEELPTYETGGKHTVRFKCNNPPGVNTYLLIYQEGKYWPQAGPFRETEKGVWEIDAHFGSTGDHSLQIVTGSDLANALVRYYRKIVDQNRNRRETLLRNLLDKFDASLLGGDYPGIEMNGLPKGFQLEASVNVKVAFYVDLMSVEAEPTTISRGKTLKIKYEIKCSEDVHKGIWLGASFKDKAGNFFHNTSEDKAVSVTRGTTIHEKRLDHSERSSAWGANGLDQSVARRCRRPVEVQMDPRRAAHSNHYH